MLIECQHMSPLQLAQSEACQGPVYVAGVPAVSRAASKGDWAFLHFLLPAGFGHCYRGGKHQSWQCAAGYTVQGRHWQGHTK